MTDLNVRNTMSPFELTILIVTIDIGGQIILAPQKNIADAGQSAWISVLLGLILFGGAALLIVTLADKYPDETFVEYMPRLWGRPVGLLIIWWFNIVFLAQFSLILSGFSQVIRLYMFLRTPVEVIQMAIVVVAVYCCLQDFGTIIKFQQFLFFTAYPLLIVLWLLSALNFTPDNLLPLWSGKSSGILKSALNSWNFFSGYEMILLLFPLVYRQNISVKQATILAFLIMTAILLLVTVMIIGVLSAKTAAKIEYPTIAVIRSVELPGTFIERLENYLLLAWVPIVFDTLVGIVYIPAQVCKRLYGHNDHRPWVMIIIPVFYMLISFLSDKEVVEMSANIETLLGVGFSFFAVPATYVNARLRKDKKYGC